MVAVEVSVARVAVEMIFDLMFTEVLFVGERVIAVLTLEFLTLLVMQRIHVLLNCVGTSKETVARFALKLGLPVTSGFKMLLT